MKPRSAAKTDVGKKRTLNEDAFLVDDDLGLYLVADGMGGHAAGEIASSEAVATAYGMVKQAHGSLKKLQGALDDAQTRAARRLMESAIQAATYMVYTLAELDREKSGMGTTITGLLVLGDHAVTAQVGDSRIYQIRDGEVRQLTEDHTLIAWQLREGIITQEEARRSPHKNVITRAVGNREYVQVDTNLVPLAQGDRYLICSDGLHGYLRAAEIPEIAERGGEEAVQAFIDLANERGGKDNSTAILVEIE
ncbi:MAG: PP2C family protein-serine/threonine phosphatase [Polyangiales bacterium]